MPCASTGTAVLCPRQRSATREQRQAPARGPVSQVSGWCPSGVRPDAFVSGKGEEELPNTTRGWREHSGREVPGSLPCFGGKRGALLAFASQRYSLRRLPSSRQHGCNSMVNSRVEAVMGGGGGTAGRSCAGCGGRIADRFLLFSMDRYWHTQCLKCSCCHAQLGEYSSTCYSKGGMILCKNDYIRLFGHSGACSACGQSIPASEMVMRARGNVYHLKCFTCATCRNRLVPGDRFHYINGTIFCEHDRPGGGLLTGHPAPLQASSMMSDQKVC